MKSIALFLIRCYQAITSTFPPRCRFTPSCSVYAYQAIEIHGFFKGSFFAFKRILRCHPFCDGGIDPVPEYKKEWKVKS
ncbi:MAG: membrane protein insertion efficiency factor YidD [Endomicrobia bacterium]|nr:membrane protein insertion efficiency factor YidD [Endomicrobiia bacterium]MCL2799826.1 membrane protein insertion efficiency factor YidD [Endomicrobiia bacterium]